MESIKIKCTYCNGTGLYAGMAERDGAAVICSKCKGTGCVVFCYTPFMGREKREDVTRVYKKGTNYTLSPKKIDFKGIGIVDLTKEGVSYEEWLDGKEPDHIHQLGCPMLVDQSACHNKEGFIEKCDELNGGWLDLIPTCSCKDKAACWERFDETVDKV